MNTGAEKDWEGLVASELLIMAVVSFPNCCSVCSSFPPGRRQMSRWLFIASRGTGLWQIGQAAVPLSAMSWFSAGIGSSGLAESSTISIHTFGNGRQQGTMLRRLLLVRREFVARRMASNGSTHMERTQTSSRSEVQFKF